MTTGRSGLPTIDSEWVVEDDQALAGAIAELAAAVSRAPTTALPDQGEGLRTRVDAETWRRIEAFRAYSAKDEGAFSLVVARWAFHEGRSFPWPAGGATPHATKAATLVTAPLAITSAGEVVLNATHVADRHVDVLETVRDLLNDGHAVFIGVVAPNEQAPQLLKELDASATVVADRAWRQLKRPGSQL